MISESEIRRFAGKWNVDPMVVNRDYVIGCFLRFLSIQETVQRCWLFKGGTALAKCYFANFRFSEDLDFTLTQAMTADDLLRVADGTKAEMQDTVGIRTDEVATHIEVIDDDYGKESFELRIYYRGPWPLGGSAPSLQIHTSRNEIIAFPAVSKPITHGYSDRHLLPRGTIKVYALEEVFAEKLRAFSGQRKHAIARDIFDLHFLAAQNLDTEEAIRSFPDKCRIKGIDPKSIDFEKVQSKKGEYEANWEGNLQYLVPGDLRVPFELAWNTAFSFLERVRDLIGS